MIWAHFVRSFRETFPTRASEWGCAAILFLWSAALAVNPALFEESRNLDKLSVVASQSTWGILCLIVGGGRLMMLAINGAWRRSPHLRAGSAFLSCFFWFQITVGLLQSETIGTGLAVYPVLLGLDIYNTLRAASDAGSSDRRHSEPQRHGTDT